MQSSCAFLKIPSRAETILLDVDSKLWCPQPFDCAPFKFALDPMEMLNPVSPASSAFDCVAVKVLAHIRKPSPYTILLSPALLKSVPFAMTFEPFIAHKPIKDALVTPPPGMMIALALSRKKPDGVFHEPLVFMLNITSIIGRKPLKAANAGLIEKLGGMSTLIIRDKELLFIVTVLASLVITIQLKSTFSTNTCSCIVYSDKS